MESRWEAKEAQEHGARQGDGEVLVELALALVHHRIDQLVCVLPHARLDLRHPLA